MVSAAIAIFAGRTDNLFFCNVNIYRSTGTIDRSSVNEKYVESMKMILTTAALVTCGIGPRSAHGKVQNKGYLSRNDWYVEILPKRFAYQGTKETLPATWPIFPSIGPAQQTMTMNGESMVLALGTFFYGSNFEKVSIDGDTTMLRLAENGTKFTPVTDEGNACVYTDGKLRSFVRFIETKTYMFHQ